MAEKPIIFNTDMVKAILDGRKTQTRRVVKPQPDDISGICEHEDGFYPIGGNLYECGGCGERIEPRYQLGDILWVRETWRLVDFFFVDGIWSASVEFKDGKRGNRLSWESMDDERISWRPSIHMYREAARIFLRVTDVRVERVHEISDEDARKEGVKAVIRHETVNGNLYNGSTTAREEFAKIWDALNAKRGYGWDANPWVWAIKFERIEKNGQTGTLCRSSGNGIGNLRTKGDADNGASGQDNGQPRQTGVHQAVS